MPKTVEHMTTGDCAVAFHRKAIFQALRERGLQIRATYFNPETGEKIPGEVSISYSGDMLAFTREDTNITVCIKPAAFLHTSFYSIKSAFLPDDSIFIRPETVQLLQSNNTESKEETNPLRSVILGAAFDDETENTDGEIMTDFAGMVLSYALEHKASHILCEKRREGIYFHILASYKEASMNESEREKMQKFFLENAGKNKNLTIGGAEDTVIIWNYALARDEFKNPHVIETLKKIIEKIHKAGDNYGLVSRISTIEREAIAELADIFSTDYPLFNEVECQIITFAHGFEREYSYPTVGSNMVCSNSDRVGVTRLTLSIRIPSK